MSILKETELFYKSVQNKLHFATTGKTAAEIICNRVNGEMPYLSKCASS